MANRRNKVMDGPVNPAIMGGLSMIADTSTITATKAITLTFPAKTINAVVVSSTADTDAEKVVWTASVTNDIGTVVLTATSAGASNKCSYIIIYTPTETIAADVVTDDAAYTPVG